MKTKVIYEPKGKALEYSQLACNLFIGCTHACDYCYGPSVMHKSNEEWVSDDLEPRDDILEKFERDAKILQGDPREILFSFASDPYFSEKAALITRGALELCERYNLKAQILTKNGARALQDANLFLSNDGWKFGSTIIFMDEKLREKHESGAPSIASRVEAVKQAHKMGIFTWVSIEPVLDPDEALKVMDELKGHVDLWKVGKLNHNKAVEESIDWKKFFYDSLDKLNGERTYFKKDLVEAAKK